MQVLMDSSSPMQKRIAAYLVLMKDPKPTELAQLAAFLPREENRQVRSFVESHIANILSSRMPETEEYGGSAQSRDVCLENQPTSLISCLAVLFHLSPQTQTDDQKCYAG